MTTPPFSRRRDDSLNQLCQKFGIDFYNFADALLNEPEQVLKDDYKPYQVFTAFYRKASQITVNWPQPLYAKSFLKLETADDQYDLNKLINDKTQSTLHGGRSQAMALLDKLEHLTEYTNIHDYPSLTGTSHLVE